MPVSKPPRPSASQYGKIAGAVPSAKKPPQLSKPSMMNAQQAAKIQNSPFKSSNMAKINRSPFKGK